MPDKELQPFDLNGLGLSDDEELVSIQALNI
jgi:hypothetical protein